MPKRVWDELDASAEREGEARSAARDTLPSVMGARISGSKKGMRSATPMTARASLVYSEKKGGFGSR